MEKQIRFSDLLLSLTSDKCIVKSKILSKRVGSLRSIFYIEEEGLLTGKHILHYYKGNYLFDGKPVLLGDVICLSFKQMLV